MLEEECAGSHNSKWCAFQIEQYKILAHRCTDRHLWEVHIHTGGDHITTFAVPIDDN